MSSLIRLLAREPDLARMIAALHQSAAEPTGATASVLLRPTQLVRGLGGQARVAADRRLVR
jgi:hypothetical protein